MYGNDYSINMTHTKETIIQLLERNDTAVGRALVALNKRQTADEQVDKTTRVHNSMGFRPCDAYMGTSLAKWFEEKGFLTAKQLAWCRKPNSKGKIRISCYAGQLLKVIEENK